MATLKERICFQKGASFFLHEQPLSEEVSSDAWKAA